MARTKKQIKSKEPVRIRFKCLANGNKSIYLDMYVDGKREYEFLKLYIVPEKDEAAKIQNANTLRAANAIKAQTIINLANGKAGIKKDPQSKMLLSDWLKIYSEAKDDKNIRYKYSIKAVRLAAEEICKRTKKKSLCDIDKGFCHAFINYIQTEYKSRIGKPLSPTTAHNYCVIFSGAMNRAVREGLINVNPFSCLENEDKISRPESERVYLTIGEVEKLKNTPLSNKSKFDIRQVFMFSVCTGLRISDIKTLTWGQIINEGGVFRLYFKQQKTGGINSFKLSNDALKWMPQRDCKTDDDNVFNVPSQTHLDALIKKWAAAASIKKNVSIHTARHTFATTCLSRDIDLYTVSKLFGHKKIETTTIYAKIVDKKKDDAIDLIDGIF